MFVDTPLRLAIAESISGINGGASAIMGQSVTAALDPSGTTPYLRNAVDISGGEALRLALSVTTGFTCATFGATLEFQLISIPIAPTLLTAVAGGRTSVATAAVAFTLASPSVGTINGHGLPLGTPVYLTTFGGGLAGTITASTIYFVVPTGVNTFTLATTLAQALTGVGNVNASTGGTATVNFLPTVHATTGVQQIFNAGSPTNQSIYALAGSRMVLPLMPMCGPTPAQRLATGQTLKANLGTAQAGQLSSNASQFYVMRFLASNAITAGAVTIDIVTEAGASNKFHASGFEVL